MNNLLVDIVLNTPALHKMQTYHIFPDGDATINWIDSSWNPGVKFVVGFGGQNMNNNDSLVDCGDGSARKVKITFDIGNRIFLNGCYSYTFLVQGEIRSRSGHGIINSQWNLQPTPDGDGYTIAIVSLYYQVERPVNPMVTYDISLTGTPIITQTMGYSTPDKNSDDQYEFKDFGLKITENNKTITTSQDGTLVLKSDSCSKTFVSGKYTLETTGSSLKAVSDFGNGDCDNKVDVTVYKGNTRITKKTIEIN
ncbi:MAG: hypothetical protein GC180_06805 [Bacteroidetes bacterium]|nr:hypothetical protein [Bacteroidota bacterium]